MSDINEEMTIAVDEHIKMIDDLIMKSVNRYCEINRVNIEKMKENKSLSREIHPSYESFFHHGVEIFRMDKKKKTTNNGIEVLYSIREFF